MAAATAGCVDSGHTLGTARGGTGGVQGLGGAIGGTGGAVGGSGGGAVVTDPPWTDSSQRIELSCSSYWEGVMGFKANRDQLSAAELDMLAGLRVVDSGDRCFSDGTNCLVSITGASGEVVSLRSYSGDSLCDGMPHRMIAEASLGPFLQSRTCQFGRKYTGPSTATPDARCWNGLGGGQAGCYCADLVVAAANEARHLELDGCAGQQGMVTMQVLEAGVDAPLAVGVPVGDPGPDGVCQKLDVVFPHAGTFRFEVTPGPGFAAGNLFFRYY